MLFNTHSAGGGEPLSGFALAQVALREERRSILCHHLHQVGPFVFLERWGPILLCCSLAVEKCLQVVRMCWMSAACCVLLVLRYSCSSSASRRGAVCALVLHKCSCLSSISPFLSSFPSAGCGQATHPVASSSSSFRVNTHLPPELRKVSNEQVQHSEGAPVGDDQVVGALAVVVLANLLCTCACGV